MSGVPTLQKIKDTGALTIAILQYMDKKVVKYLISLCLKKTFVFKLNKFYLSQGSYCYCEVFQALFLKKSYRVWDTILLKLKLFFS